MDSQPSELSAVQTAHPALEDRRSALAGTAVAAAALAAMAFNARTAEAQGTGDVAIMNSLLAAEYNAIKAYDAGAGILSAPPMGDPMASAAPVVLAVAAHFQQQHRDHAAALAAMITGVGGTPITADSVTFAPPTGLTPSVTNVIKLAANAEKLAAIGYATTLQMATTQLGAKLIAAIGGVETQHYLVLSLIARGVVAPTAATMAMAMEVVPRSFIDTSNSVAGLNTLPDFTY